MTNCEWPKAKTVAEAPGDDSSADFGKVSPQFPDVESRRAALAWPCIVFWWTYGAAMFTGWSVYQIASAGSLAWPWTAIEILFFLPFVAGWVLPVGCIVLLILGLLSSPIAYLLIGDQEAGPIKRVLCISAVPLGLAAGPFGGFEALMLGGVGILASACVLIRYLMPNSYRDVLGHCGKCGYDLTGNISGSCPECGTPHS